MTEPKTQTERAKAFIESRTEFYKQFDARSNLDWLVTVARDFAAVEVEAATRGLREQLEAVMREIAGRRWLNSNQLLTDAEEYLKKHEANL